QRLMLSLILCVLVSLCAGLQAYVLFSCNAHPPHLHSFPTRRSSDLRPHQRPGAGGHHAAGHALRGAHRERGGGEQQRHEPQPVEDRKSTRLNSSHVKISYAVFCLKKKMSTIKSYG